MSVFFDTNVLVYADDQLAGDKTERARSLIERELVARNGVVSTQVLQEYYSAATRKLGLNGAQARARVELYAGMDVVRLSAPMVLEAIDLHRHESVQFRDALILRAAQVAGCDTLYSEDLQAGRSHGRVRVVNPFA